jgi:hypothetical protein
MTDLTIDGGRGLVIDEGRVGDWSQTYTGRRFYPLDPRPEDIDLLDIAVALSNISRYGGHCRFYSVAEHSVLVSRMVAPEHRLSALFHDAAEAYVQDLTRPIKRALRDLGQFDGFKALDAAVQAAIEAKFGLSPIPREVIEADTAICALEREVLHPRAQAWDLPEVPLDLVICASSPKNASRDWLRKACGLLELEYVAYEARLCELETEDRMCKWYHSMFGHGSGAANSNYPGKDY